MNLEAKKCFELFCETSDLATDWLLDFFNETDPLEKEINHLQYLKADKKRFELVRRLNKCQK